MCSAVVLLVLLFLTPALYHVPRAVLAAIVVTAVAGLFRKRGFVGRVLSRAAECDGGREHVAAEALRRLAR